MEYADTPVEVVDHDDRWPDLYERERERVLASIGSTPERVEHVGSTAVPDLAAKPVVDLLAVFPGSGLRAAADAVRSDPGYEVGHRRDGWTFLRRPCEHEAATLFHLHLFAADAEGWRDSMALREYLRADPETAAEYERVKRELAAGVDGIREYDRRKADFVERATERARERFDPRESEYTVE